MFHERRALRSPLKTSSAMRSKPGRSWSARSESSWYEEHGSDVDHAALALCRLRRASSGRHGGPGHGDDAVRDALAGVNTGAIVWLLSRAISYMDESGFPEAVAPWFPDEEPAV